MAMAVPDDTEGPRAPETALLAEALASGRRLLSVTEVARILDVSETTAWTLARSGELPSLKVGRLVKIDGRRLEEWIDRKVKEGWYPS